MQRSRILLAQTLAIVSLSVMAEASNEAQNAEKIASNAVTSYASSMKQLLLGALKSGSIEAITACKASAQKLSSDDLRVTIGRSATRLRNSQNAPTDWVSAEIGKMSSSSADKPAKPVTVALAGKRYGYVAPIYTQEMCLQCHGSSISKEVSARLQKEYPNDQATGFEAGSFRGVFWAEIDLSKEK